MKQRYQYRIYPTEHQRQRLSQVFGCARIVWNDSLSWVMQTPEDTQWPSNAELQTLCITLAKQYPARAWLSEVSVVALQQSVQDLGVAFKNFFEHRAKFPKFKKKAAKQSVRFTRRGFSLKHGKVFIAKVGAIKTKWSRSLPCPPSSVTIIKDTVGRYFASFVVDVGAVVKSVLNESVGVDLGIKTFAVLSTGEEIHSPEYKTLERKVRRAQRTLSRRQRGSNRYERQRMKVARLKARLAAKRKDFLDKLSTRLVEENTVVCLEDLNVAGMVKNRRLARAISEAGWGTFRRMCEAKAACIVDRTISVISRWEPTSQVCSDCGFRWGKLDLSIRSILCVSCGTQQCRDINASRNIAKAGVGRIHSNQKWTSSECKTGNPAVCDEVSSQPYQGKQLCLSL